MKDEETPAITAFHGIFEQRFLSIVKQIKKIRKHPGKESRVKELLIEAKHLKKLIKKDRKKGIKHSIEIPIKIVDGQISLGQIGSTNPVRILDTRMAGGLLIVDFETPL